MILPEDSGCTSSHHAYPVDSISGSKRDDTYFWDMVTFSVEDSLFRVPRYQFIVGSQYFAATYLNAPSNPLLTLDNLAFNDGRSEYSEEYEAVEAPGGSTPTAIDTPTVNKEPQCERAVALGGVTSAQFRTFLKLLFPIHSTSITVTLTKPEWSSILALSTLWHFNHFRALAIHHLDQPLTDPIELILVGRSSFVTEWVLRGYEALVLKDEAIEEDESEMIGDKTSVKLYIIRHGLARRLNERTEHEAQVAFVRDQFAIRFRAELDELRREEGRRRIRSENDEEGATGGNETSDDQSTSGMDTKGQEEMGTADAQSEKESFVSSRPIGISMQTGDPDGNENEEDCQKRKDEDGNEAKESGMGIIHSESEQGEGLGGEQIGKGQVDDGNGGEAGANVTQPESKLGNIEQESGIKGEVRAGGEDGVNKEEITIGKLEVDETKHVTSTKSEIKEMSTEEEERQGQEKLERKRERKKKRAEKQRREEEKRKEEESQAPPEAKEDAVGAILEELHRVQKELYCIDAEKQKLKASEEREAKAREERRRALAKIADQDRKRLQQEADEARKKEELEVLKRRQQELAAAKLPGEAAAQSWVGLLPGWK